MMSIRTLSTALLTACALLVLSSTSASAQALADLVDVTVETEALAPDQIGKRFSAAVRGSVPLSTVNGVAVEIGFDSEIEEVLIRFNTDGPDAPWLPMVVVPSATGGTAVAGYRRQEAFTASTFEIRVQASEGASVLIRDVGFFDTAADAEEQVVSDV
ncbi:MAG: hypothetical protein EBR20_08355, partial [Bacteroidetes bacterium]|nr:hypothetical protein [Bacteroidota bacterium]